jgi:hypothetical protein
MRIGFSSRCSILSKTIRYLTHSKASHAYIVFSVGEEELVIQSGSKGVYCEHYEVFRQHAHIVAEYQLSITPKEENLILDYALKQLLKPYDYLAIVGFGWILLNKSFGRKAKQLFRNKSAYFCSELIIAYLQNANFPLSHLFDKEITSPEDIIEFLDMHLMAKLVLGTHHAQNS